jgi:hypothetical protein
MKEYNKPLIEYFDLRTEEGIACTGSNCNQGQYWKGPNN